MYNKMQGKSGIQNFLSTLKDHVQKLMKFQEQVLRPRKIQKYPTKQLLSFYQKDLIPKIKDRGNKSQILADILMWYLPQIMVLTYKVEACIKVLPPEAVAQSTDPHDNEQAAEDSPKKDPTAILRMPVNFLQQQMIECLKSCADQQVQKGKKIYVQQIQNFIKLFSKLRQSENNNDLSLPIEQYQSKIRGMLYPNIKNPKCRIVVKFGFRFLFIAKLKLRVKRANKHINERRLRILQLIEGERKYINGLADYIQYIKIPICKLKVLSQLQTKKMFSSIESILAFHKILQQQLSARFQKYHKYQTYGDIIKRNIPFFKLYTEYIEYADEAQALILNLQQNNQDVKAICTKFMQEKQKKASDQLKQPTFRVARYGMILNQILKNTNSSHPDYLLLKQALKQTTTNLTKINETVDSIARRTRLHQLEQQFGTEQRPIFTPQRNFIQQFHLYYIVDDKLEPVFVFIFSDLVIVIDQNRKVLNWIDVDSKFYARREEDNKTYRNIVKIQSSGFLTFSAGNQDRHFAKAESFYKVLKGISHQSKQLQRMVLVHVIGTQQINTSTFSKYTEYIAQIKYLGLRKFTRLRFSLMKSFVSKIQQFYKSDLGINMDESLKDGWFSNYNSKTIEDRKRLIEQILQKMLNHEIIITNPSFILNQLGIEPSFIKAVKVSQRKKSPSNDLQMLSPLIKVKSQQKYIREAETILCATEIKLGRDSYHDPEYINKKVSESQRFTIYVHTMVGSDPMPIKISDLYTVQDVCYQVSNLLDLKTNRDFKLFHEVGKKQLRVLDNDKKIIKLFNFPKKQTKGSSWYQILETVKNYIIPDATPPKLIFKKYYFLPIEIQKSECKKDTTRLRLIVYQIFNQIKDMKYNLSFEDYLLFLAILIYIEYDGKVQEEIEAAYVNRIIPEKIFKIKNQTEQYWLCQCRPHLNWLNQQITKIIQENKEKAKNRKIRSDSIIHFGHRHICSQLALSKIRSSIIFGSNLFYVQLSKQTYQKFQKIGKKPVYNMWLAIKVDSFMLLSPTSKQVILEVELKNIQKIAVQAQGVIFKLESLVLCEYSLNTYQSFQISELVKYYKCLTQTIQQLQNNQSLVVKTKVYKQQLSNYRNSYEKAERETMAAQNTKEQINQIFQALS